MYEGLPLMVGGKSTFYSANACGSDLHVGQPKEIVSFCDASWGIDAVSGAILIYRGFCVKFFSRKQEVPALSSAEAEIISIVETAKDMVWLGMLLQTMANLHLSSELVWTFMALLRSCFLLLTANTKSNTYFFASKPKNFFYKTRGKPKPLEGNPKETRAKRQGLPSL